VVRRNARRNIRSLARHGLTRRSSLLDYGAGRGAFCAEGRSPRWRSYDPYTFPEVVFPAGAGVLDWITLWGVLEHLPAPRRTLGRLGAALAPGGRLALTTLTIESSIPYQHKPPEHVTYWTEAALETLLGRCGLAVEDYRPYVMVQKAEVYLGAVLRTVPDRLRRRIHHRLPGFVEVPTNEIWVIARKR
jgi:hypothetical protein